MTFQQLTYVVEVAHCASINKAAEHLYTHQSNVSNVIRQLEEELNVQLFFRTQKGVQLTSAGREFLVYAQDLVDKKNLLEQMYTLRNTHQPSRFCISSMRSFFAYAPLIAMDQQHKILSQPWNIRIQKRPFTGVLEDVSCGGADLGLLFTMKSKCCRLPQLAKMKQVT